MFLCQNALSHMSTTSVVMHWPWSKNLSKNPRSFTKIGTNDSAQRRPIQGLKVCLVNLCLRGIFPSPVYNMDEVLWQGTLALVALKWQCQRLSSSPYEEFHPRNSKPVAQNAVHLVSKWSHCSLESFIYRLARWVWRQKIASCAEANIVSIMNLKLQRWWINIRYVVNCMIINLLLLTM